MKTFSEYGIKDEDICMFTFDLGDPSVLEYLIQIAEDTLMSTSDVTQERRIAFALIKLIVLHTAEHDVLNEFLQYYTRNEFLQYYTRK